MPEKHLHIISLNTPDKIGYGSVYDLFYKLPSLQQQGVKIHLHCFTENSHEQAELNKFCEEVLYYKSNTSAKTLPVKLPYIISTHYNEHLIKRLLQDNYPVFMEGVPCTYITNDTRFDTRKMFVRIHDVENEYYKQLYKFSNGIKKKIYYWLESKQLYAYEKRLSKNATAYWAVTQNDTDYYKEKLDCKTMDYLSLFTPAWQINSLEGTGMYCLYHGNLEAKENEYAVIWLVKNIFRKLEIPFVVAGKNPSKKIASVIEKYKHTCLVANPDEKHMQDIIAKAHIHVLPSFNNTGIKIKLLNALYNGRHCIVNEAMLAAASLKEVCHVAATAADFEERIRLLYHQPFTANEKDFRKKVLEREFSNEINAKQMVKWIWEVYA